MGVIDFDEGTAAIDAVLVDSRLAHKFPLTGAAALRRAGLGRRAELRARGRRVQPALRAAGRRPGARARRDRAELRQQPAAVCEAYFAITSNTVQFGARAPLYAAASGFSVEGDVGFDVLVQLAPLHFIADFHARCSSKRGSHNLFMVVARTARSKGPRPLRVSGKATFEILWCDFSVRFDTTLVDGEPPPLPPAVDVLAQLNAGACRAAELEHAAQRGTHARRGAAQPAAGEPTAPLVLDPLGQLRVRQQVVPLNTARDIDTFGGAPVAGARRFAAHRHPERHAAAAATPLTAPFAPAQFFAMSDDEKLAAPSFESMDAGMRLRRATRVASMRRRSSRRRSSTSTSSITLDGRQPVRRRRHRGARAVHVDAPLNCSAFARSGAAARAPCGASAARASATTPSKRRRGPDGRRLAHRAERRRPRRRGRSRRAHAGANTRPRSKR